MKKKKGLKQMQVLKYIEDSFNSFSLKVKIELFILPLFIFGILFLFFDEEKKLEIEKVNISKELKNLNMNENIVDILKNIEKQVNKESLKIKTISSDKKSINLELVSNKKRIIKFLKYLEDYNSFSKIEALSIREKSLKVELVFKDLYIKEKIDLSNRISKLEEEKKIELNLFAIIDNKAYINNKWLNINDIYKSYKLISIDTNSVSLQDEYEIIKLKMYEHENF